MQCVPLIYFRTLNINWKMHGVGWWHYSIETLNIIVTAGYWLMACIHFHITGTGFTIRTCLGLEYYWLHFQETVEQVFPLQNPTHCGSI